MWWLKQAVTLIFTLFGIANWAIAQAQSGSRASAVDAILSAKFNDYKDMYPKSSLCEAHEITLWRCESHKRKFALCSSQLITKTTGYLQYRASNSGRIEFVFPATKQSPLDRFSYDSLGNGDAVLSFSNQGYQYELFDPLRDRSTLLVTPPSKDSKSVAIACQANQTLQLNYTMRLMYESGLWSRGD